MTQRREASPRAAAAGPRVGTLEQRLAWLERGSDEFLSLVDSLADGDFARPSALPGWTVAHVVAHVAYNASALSRLVQWARTGEENRMYASVDARNAEIEQGAALRPDELRALAHSADERLRSGLAELPGERWQAEVLTAQGRTVPATEIPWMRTREVWIHGVDLGAGATYAGFPADLVDALIDDLVAWRGKRGDEPALLLRPTDRDRTWEIPGEGAEPVVVTGEAAALSAWLTGRGGDVSAEDGSVPDLGRWL